MFRAFLIGAGLAALFDAATAFRIAEIDTLHLEYMQWSMFGTLSIACLMGLGMKWLFGLRVFAGWQARLNQGQAFWAGLVMGLMPILTVFFPILETAGIPMGGMNRFACLFIWCLPILLLLRLAPTAPAFARPGAKLLTPLALLTPILTVVAVGIGVAKGQDPPPRPQLPGAEPLTTDLSGRPDLVLVSLDTLRSDLQRDQIDLMPFLTELKEEGMYPRRCVSTSNQTVPGHIGLLAGLDQDQHLVNRNSEMIWTPSETMFASKAKAIGYRTAAVISNAMVTEFPAGFEAFDETRADYGDRYYFKRIASGSTWFGKVYGNRRAGIFVEDWLNVAGEDTLPPGMSAYTTDSAIAYLNEFTLEDRPYFLFAHYMDPHSPYTPPSETADRFAKPTDLPEAYAKIGHNHSLLINQIRNDLETEVNREVALKAAAHLRDLYDEELLYMDMEVRRLVDAIRTKGRPTLLIITSDHGEYFGEHNLIEHSRGLFATVIDVPFVAVGLNGFDVPQGEVPELFSIIDVVPTMAEAAGVDLTPQDEGVELEEGKDQMVRRGIDLLAPDAAEKLKGRVHFLGWNSTKRGLMAAAEDGNWKVIGKYVPPETPNGYPEMQELWVYKTADDPGELQDLGAEVSAEVEHLWERVALGGRNWRDLGMFDPNRRTGLLDTSKALELEALGYVNPVGPPVPPKKDDEDEDE